MALEEAEVISNLTYPVAPAERWRLTQCDPKQVLFIGRFDRHKGYDLIVEAFGKFLRSARRRYPTTGAGGTLPEISTSHCLGPGRPTGSISWEWCQTQIGTSLASGYRDDRPTNADKPETQASSPLAAYCLSRSSACSRVCILKIRSLACRSHLANWIEWAWSYSVCLPEAAQSSPRFGRRGMSYRPKAIHDRCHFDHDRRHRRAPRVGTNDFGLTNKISERFGSEARAIRYCGPD